MRVKPMIGEYEVPLVGSREQCGMPAASTPLARAVELAFADAHDVLIAFPEESRSAQEALQIGARGHMDFGGSRRR